MAAGPSREDGQARDGAGAPCRTGKLTEDRSDLDSTGLGQRGVRRSGDRATASTIVHVLLRRQLRRPGRPARLCGPGPVSTAARPLPWPRPHRESSRVDAGAQSWSNSWRHRRFLRYRGVSPQGASACGLEQDMCGRIVPRVRPRPASGPRAASGSEGQSEAGRHRARREIHTTAAMPSARPRAARAAVPQKVLQPGSQCVSTATAAALVARRQQRTQPTMGRNSRAPAVDDPDAHHDGEVRGDDSGQRSRAPGMRCCGRYNRPRR